MWRLAIVRGSEENVGYVGLCYDNTLQSICFICDHKEIQYIILLSILV